MPAYAAKTCFLEERFESAVHHVLSVEGGALACGENEARVLVIRRPVLSSSWFLRCFLRASMAFWGKSMVRLEAFLGSLNTSPTAPYVCETQIYVPRECKLDELRGPNSHPEAR